MLLTWLMARMALSPLRRASVLTSGNQGMPDSSSDTTPPVQVRRECSCSPRNAARMCLALRESSTSSRAWPTSKRCAQPDASESISAFPLYDRNITRLVEQAGADVLPIFNATWSRSDNHPPLRKGGVRLRNSAFDRAFANRTVSDCTHYCSRGSVLRFWTQALVSWLEETQS